MNSISAKLAFEEQLKKMGFDVSKIASVVDLVNNDAMCGPDCQRQKKLNELRDAMTAAQKVEKEAPENLADARRNYYTFKDGEKGYLDAQLDEKRKEAIAETLKLKAEFDNRVKRTQTLVDEYNAMLVYSENMDDLLNTYITSNQRLAKDIDKVKSNAFTNDRRFHYFDQSIEWQTYVNKIVMFFYWVLVVAYVAYYLIYKGHYSNYKSLLYGLILLILPLVIIKILVFKINGYSIQNILDQFTTTIIRLPQ